MGKRRMERNPQTGFRSNSRCPQSASTVRRTITSPRPRPSGLLDLSGVDNRSKSSSESLGPLSSITSMARLSDS